MNERIRELAERAGYQKDSFGFGHWDMPEFHNFVRLFQEEIKNDLRNELIPNDIIDAETDIEDRCYLRGSNGGIVDAMCIVQNFGEEIEE
jgi:hypothetical protein